MGNEVRHRTNVYLNNRIEQGHQAIKQRSYPMRGFGNVVSATRFCRAFDEGRQFFGVRTSVKQKVSLAQHREAFHQRLDLLKTLVLAVSCRKACGRSRARARCSHLRSQF